MLKKMANSPLDIRQKGTPPESARESNDMKASLRFPAFLHQPGTAIQ
jgi:hypothetical protein